MALGGQEQPKKNPKGDARQQWENLLADAGFEKGWGVDRSNPNPDNIDYDKLQKDAEAARQEAERKARERESAKVEKPIDPADKAKILDRFKKIIEEELLKKIPKKWNYERQFYDEIFTKLPLYYYSIAVIHNWGEDSTAEKLRTDVSKLFDSLSKEKTMKEIGNFFANNVWGTVSDSDPEPLANRTPGVEIDAMWWQNIENALTEAQTFFYNEYVSKDGKKDRKPEDFRGLEDRSVSIPMLGSIPKPWKDKAPIEMVNEVNIPFFARLIAADTTAQYGYRSQTNYSYEKDKIAQAFYKRLVDSYAVTFANDSLAQDFRKKVRKDQGKIMARIGNLLPSPPPPMEALNYQFRTEIMEGDVQNLHSGDTFKIKLTPGQDIQNSQWKIEYTLANNEPNVATIMQQTGPDWIDRTQGLIELQLNWNLNHGTYHLYLRYKNTNTSQTTTWTNPVEFKVR